MHHFNWNHLQAFIAVARCGSLSGAARELTVSQPTIGRTIAALEKDLGVLLFVRAKGGMEITPTGLDLLDFARRIQRQTDDLSLAAAGRAEAIKGTVRITASQIVAVYLLPDILTALRRAEPEIEVELVASDRTENLLAREADIAVRMYRPLQLDLISRKVAELPLGMFAAKTYLVKHGSPATLQEFKAHHYIGYDQNEMIIRGFRAAGLDVDRSFFAFRSDDQVVCWKMVVAGLGIGFSLQELGKTEPRVEQIVADFELPTLPVWLTAHAEVKTGRRVRRVYDFLASHLGSL